MSWKKNFINKKGSCFKMEDKSPLNKFGDKRRAKKAAEAKLAAERAAYDAKLKDQQKDLPPAKTSVKPNPPTYSDNNKTRKVPKHGSF
tara:strand:- start:44 stop:307 length:264 start_codon:yes stop_codon:yes gene_type:complete